MAREFVANDLAMLQVLDQHVDQAEEAHSAVVTSVPNCATPCQCLRRCDQ